MRRNGKTALITGGRRGDREGCGVTVFRIGNCDVGIMGRTKPKLGDVVKEAKGRITG